MNIIENAPLDDLTTFRVPARGRYLVTIESASDFPAVVEHPEFNRDNFLVLGGGSNILFTADYPGWILQVGINHLEVLEETATDVFLKVGAGVNWHDLVLKATGSGWYGIENLALIPGLAGAAPVQNIGAYGVEFQDVFYSLSAFDSITGNELVLSKDECEFGYRKSIFKRRPELIVTDISIKLSKIPQVRTGYGAIEDMLRFNGIDRPSPADVMEAVIDIRRSKLPDPAKLGNAGSFFKNPVVSAETADQIKGQYQAFPVYPAADDLVKTSAAWLIEQSGWKGHRRGNCGVYKNHALVLVNYGGATGGDIQALVKDIQDSVEDKFGIRLQPEVKII